MLLTILYILAIGALLEYLLEFLRLKPGVLVVVRFVVAIVAIIAAVVVAVGAV